MAVSSEAMMVLFYDIEGDTADHDDWHSNQHFQERLSVPGFLRATRWVATSGSPRYLVTYDVAGTGVGTSSSYLERLNNPTPWTCEMMPRFRGMTRGFCDVVASGGLGLGAAALSLRFAPKGDSAAMVAHLSDEMLPRIAAAPGIARVLLLRPVAQSPMTHEQSLRGADQPMPWLILVMAHDQAGLQRAAAAHVDMDVIADITDSDDVIAGHYMLAHTATTEDAAASV